MSILSEEEYVGSGFFDFVSVAKFGFEHSEQFLGDLPLWIHAVSVLGTFQNIFITLTEQDNMHWVQY